MLLPRRSAGPVSIVVALAIGAAPAACVGIAGIGDYAVDPCFDGCGDGGLDGTTPTETSTGDGPVGEGGGDAPADAPLVSPGLSDLVLSGTGVAVGQKVVATLTTRNEAGDKVARLGAKLTFAFTGGTSALSAATATDLGDGTYRIVLTGVSEGTKVSVVASIDGAPLKTPAPQIRVVNPVSSGLTFMIDAANVDNAGNAGSKGCPAAGPATWIDLGPSHFPGALRSFVSVPCGVTSGWAGTGTPEDPFRIALDGVDDNVDFDAVNSITATPASNTKQTVLAWMRKTGAGTPGSSGVGNPAGIAACFPVVAKGTADGDMVDDSDINYFLSVTTANFVGVDYEVTGTHANVPLVGTTAISDNTWYLIGYTVDFAASSRIVYLNGVSEATSTTAGAPSAGLLSHLVIGGGTRVTGTPGAIEGRFKGDIAMVMTYNRVLSPAEIGQNCHALSSRFGMKSCPN